MTSSEDIIKKLAEMPCPTCVGCGRTVGCNSCDGSGVRFPWLRTACIECNNWEGAKPGMHRTPQGYTWQCVGCGGRGWVPRLDIPAWEAITHFHEVRVERKQVGWWVCIRVAPTHGGIDAHEDSLPLAFWRAVEKVLND